MLKDLARAISLANLCFMAVWSTLISPSLNPQAQYTRYRFNAYIAVIINVLCLAAVLWVAATLMRRFANPAAGKLMRWGFLVFMILPVHAVIQTQAPGLALETPAALLSSSQKLIGIILLVSLASFAAARYTDRAVKVLSTLLLLMFPFAFWTFGKAAYIMSRFGGEPPAPPVAASGDKLPRAVWLVFDELDQQLTFSERPAGLEMPALDRLRNESIYAENAYAPAGRTLFSLPALISGKLVSSAYVTSPSDLMINFEGAQELVNWGEQPNVFTEARKLGLNATLVGWYHPYHRMIGDSVIRCVSEGQRGRALVPSILNQWRSVVLSLPLAPSVKPVREMWLGRFKGSLAERQEYRAQLYKRMLDEAKKGATDPGVGLTFVHWAFPHNPVIYSREKQDFKPGKKANYLDNLALVDRTVGELRREMEAAGVWEDAIVLVTSDHHLRNKRRVLKTIGLHAAGMRRRRDHRIPFLLKLPGQRQGAVYDSEFNTVLTAGLVLALLRGDLTSVESVAGWLDANRTIGESPYGNDPPKVSPDAEE